MVLGLATIFPHGRELIPEFGKNNTKLTKLREAIKKVSLEFELYKPETIVVITPHNARVTKNITVITSEFVSGSLEEKNKSAKLNFRCDRGFAEKLLTQSWEEGLEVVGVNFGTDKGKMSRMQLDWGSFVPLWFLAKPRNKVVIVSPSRDLSLQRLYKFGEIIGNLASRSSSRIALIASADQAHTHKKSGPYGYNKRAKEYDTIIIKAIKENKLNELIKIDSELVNEAKPDSLWQMIILAGTLKKGELTPELLSYEVPSYFGMLVAIYRH